MSTVGIIEIEEIKKRIRLCDYLVVAQLFLKDNFFLDRELIFDDIKPRLLAIGEPVTELTLLMPI